VQVHQRLGAERLDGSTCAAIWPWPGSVRRRSSGRMPTKAALATVTLAAGISARSTTFICGVPMNWATKRLAGLS
jgi:hypothetical protein